MYRCLNFVGPLTVNTSAQIGHASYTDYRKNILSVDTTSARAYTTRVTVPSGYGYVNLGDAGVYLCALLLPGGLGALAAGVGAALADLILGWAVYAPVTLLIKGLQRQTARCSLGY